MFLFEQGGLLTALDRDAADGITGSEHILKAYEIPHCLRGKIPREAAVDSRPDSGTGSRLFEINMWMWRYGRTFPRQISVDQAVEFRKKGRRNPGLVALRLFGAGVMQPGQRELPLRSE